jgi:hypothetical protein
MTGHISTDDGGVSAHCVQRDPLDGGDAETAAACLLAEGTAFARMAAQGPTRAYAAHKPCCRPGPSAGSPRLTNSGLPFGTDR